MMAELKNLINYFFVIHPILGYFSFCLLATFIVISLLGFHKDFLLAKSSVQNTSNQRFNNVDFLKILLTYAIVLHHECQPLHLPNQARNSVELFFVISGFMLFYRYIPGMSIMEFVRKKIVYFFPYLFLGNLFAFLVLYPGDVKSFLAGIFMYADTLLYPRFSTYSPSWYIITLFWVSLFYFSMMKTLSKEVCHLVIGIIALITWSAMGEDVMAIAINVHLPILTDGQVRALSCISVGYFMALNYKPMKKTMPNLFYTVLELCLLVGLSLIFFKEGYEIPTYFIVMLFIVLFWLFIHQKGYISAALEKINWLPFSKYMLPIFMTHWVITMLQYDHLLWEGYSFSSHIILTLLCSTLLGIVSYHVIYAGFYFQRIWHKN